MEENSAGSAGSMTGSNQSDGTATVAVGSDSSACTPPKRVVDDVADRVMPPSSRRDDSHLLHVVSEVGDVMTRDQYTLQNSLVNHNNGIAPFAVQGAQPR